MKKYFYILCVKMLIILYIFNCGMKKKPINYYREHFNGLELPLNTNHSQIENLGEYLRSKETINFQGEKIYLRNYTPTKNYYQHVFIHFFQVIEATKNEDIEKTFTGPQIIWINFGRVRYKRGLSKNTETSPLICYSEITTNPPFINTLDQTKILRLLQLSVNHLDLDVQFVLEQPTIPFYKSIHLTQNAEKLGCKEENDTAFAVVDPNNFGLTDHAFIFYRHANSINKILKNAEIISKKMLGINLDERKLTHPITETSLTHFSSIKYQKYLHGIAILIGRITEKNLEQIDVTQALSYLSSVLNNPLLKFDGGKKLFLVFKAAKKTYDLQPKEKGSYPLIDPQKKYWWQKIFNTSTLSAIKTISSSTTPTGFLLGVLSLISNWFLNDEKSAVSLSTQEVKPYIDNFIEIAGIKQIRNISSLWKHLLKHMRYITKTYEKKMRRPLYAMFAIAYLRRLSELSKNQPAESRFIKSDFSF